MTIMKEQTTCGRREMRALMQSRKKNVAPPETRARYTGLTGVCGPIIDRPAGRTRRDHGTAAWGAKLTEAAKALPRKLRRALSGVRKVSDMETLVAMETLLRVKAATR